MKPVIFSPTTNFYVPREFAYKSETRDRYMSKARENEQKQKIRAEKCAKYIEAKKLALEAFAKALDI